MDLDNGDTGGAHSQGGDSVSIFIGST